MRLYQHTARCPVALRSFLECNPNYWCFVPMSSDDILTENVVHFHGDDNQIDPEVRFTMELTTVRNERTLYDMASIPMPPDAYGFSYRQRQNQRQFFEQLTNSLFLESPYSSLDLHRVAIIAVCM